MKQVLALPETAELELLKNMLKEAGIPCEFRNEQLSQALPATPFNIELWVSNDIDFPRAEALCQGWLHPPGGEKGSWECAQCGQRLRSQFDSCWKCGAARQTGRTIKSKGADDENNGRFVD